MPLDPVALRAIKNEVRTLFRGGFKSSNKLYDDDPHEAPCAPPPGRLLSGRQGNTHWRIAPGKDECQRRRNNSINARMVMREASRYFATERREHDPIGYARFLLSRPLLAGNCTEMAAIAMYLVMQGKAGFARLCFISWPGDHCFCLVTAQPRDLPHDLRSLQMLTAEAWVIDPWSNICCRADQYRTAFSARMFDWSRARKLIYTTNPHNSSERVVIDPAHPLYLDSFLSGQLVNSVTAAFDPSEPVFDCQRRSFISAPAAGLRSSMPIPDWRLPILHQELRMFFKGNLKSSNKHYADNGVDGADQSRRFQRNRNANAALNRILALRAAHSDSAEPRWRIGQRVLLQGRLRAGDALEMSMATAYLVSQRRISRAWICTVNGPLEHNFCLISHDIPPNALSGGELFGIHHDGWVIDVWSNICCPLRQYAENFIRKLVVWQSQAKLVEIRDLTHRSEYVKVSPLSPELINAFERGRLIFELLDTSGIPHDEALPHLRSRL